MRKLVLGLVAGASALAFAAPATAQYYPGPYGYGDGYSYGYRQMSPRALERRIYNVMRSLGGVRPDYREQLRAEAFRIDRRLGYASRNGLNYYEYHDIDVRIGRLERRVGWAARNGRYGYGDRYYAERQWHDRGGGWRGDYDRDD
jgi:hypothetical protein